jgi:hypothetical protein
MMYEYSNLIVLHTSPHHFAAECLSCNISLILYFQYIQTFEQISVCCRFMGVCVWREIDINTERGQSCNTEPLALGILMSVHVIGDIPNWVTILYSCLSVFKKNKFDRPFTLELYSEIDF